MEWSERLRRMVGALRGQESAQERAARDLVERMERAATSAAMSATAAADAARRAESAASDVLQVVPASVALHARALPEGHDSLSVLPFRHDRMSGDRMSGARPGGGAGDGAWRALDTDIETLD